MKRGLTSFFLAFSLVFVPVAARAAASAPDVPERYFVPTTKALWKKSFGVRHEYEDGFTADLGPLQLRLAKLAGLKPIPAKRYSILAEQSAATPEPAPTPAASSGWGVRVVAGKSSLTGAGVTIAVLDTGIDREHPDLRRRMEVCLDFAQPSSSLAEDSCADANGHGTHVAGIMVADGGPLGDGMFGIAPLASVSAYRVCNDDGVCLSDDIAAGITRAVDDGAQILVLGFGGEERSSFIDEALAYAAERQVLVVAGSGNDGPYQDSLDWPARDTRVVSVGALDAQREPAGFSSRGINDETDPYVLEEGDVEFAAPAVNVESAFTGGGYAVLSGTSMAAPHVAGLAALIWQADAESPAEATRLLLRQSAVDVDGEGDDAASGWGMPVAQ